MLGRKSYMRTCSQENEGLMTVIYHICAGKGAMLMCITSNLGSKSPGGLKEFSLFTFLHIPDPVRISLCAGTSLIIVNISNVYLIHNCNQF